MKKIIRKMFYVEFCLFIFIIIFNINKVKAEGNETNIYFLSKISNTFGQGDCIIIEKNGKYGLIDSGRPETNNENNPYLNNFLKEKNIKELEFVILTHIHNDHIGGMEYLLKDESIKIDKVYLKQIDSRVGDKDKYNKIINLLVYRKIPIVGVYNEKYSNDDSEKAIYRIENACTEDEWIDYFKDNNYIRKFDDQNTLFDFQGDKVQLFNYGYNYSDEIFDENDRSLGILITHESKKIFLAGDINNYAHNLEDGDAKGTEDIIASKIGKVDLLKVGHHGYENSSTKDFLNKLHPSYAIVTNDVGKVSQSLIYELNKIDCKCYYTTQDEKALIVKVNDDRIQINYETPCGYKFQENNIQNYYNKEYNEISVTSWSELKNIVDSGKNYKININQDANWDIDQKIVLNESQYIELICNARVYLNRKDGFLDNFFELNSHSMLDIKTNNELIFDGKNHKSNEGIIKNNYGVLILNGNIIFKNNIRETNLNLTFDDGVKSEFFLKKNTGVINSTGLIKASGITVENNSHKFSGNIKISQKLDNNFSVRGYGGGISSCGYIELENSKIFNNSLDSEISFELENFNSTFDIESYNNGAGIFYQYGILDNCSILNNVNDNHSKFNIKKVTLNRITTTSYGGGIRTAISEIQNSKIENNISRNNTNIIHIFSKFDLNVVARGGGIYSNDSFEFLLLSCEVKNNDAESKSKSNILYIADANGGGINLFRPTNAVIKKCNISKNYASKGNGGGVMVDCGNLNVASLNIEDSNFDNNESKSGRNVYSIGNVNIIGNNSWVSNSIYSTSNSKISFYDNNKPDVEIIEHINENYNEVSLDINFKNIVYDLKKIKINNVLYPLENNSCKYITNKNETIVVNIEDIEGNSFESTYAIESIDDVSPIITNINENNQYYVDFTPNIEEGNSLSNKEKISGIKEVTLLRNGEKIDFSIGNTIESPGDYELIAEDNAGNSMRYLFKILYLRGDINDDGKVNILDLIKLRSYLVGNIQFSESEECAADLNGDNQCNIIDLIAMRKKLVE